MRPLHPWVLPPWWHSGNVTLITSLKACPFLFHGPPQDPLVFLLWSESTLCALSIAVVASPQTVKLAEVHVRQDPARLVGLRRLAASLAEEASVPGAGAGALGLGVRRLEGGSGALAAGKRGRTEEGRGERWLVGGGGCRDGYEGGDGGARRNGIHRGDERIWETGQRGGERKRMGSRRVGGKI